MNKFTTMEEVEASSNIILVLAKLFMPLSALHVLGILAGIMNMVIPSVVFLLVPVVTAILIFLKHFI